MHDSDEHDPRSYDVVIVGGGPAGLSAALTLGRARRRVLLCDGPVRRNAAALALHNFVTRDGTTPLEFRRIGRAQLAPYTSVEVRDQPVRGIDGEPGAFAVDLGSAKVHTRRVLLCTGMIDEMLDLPGFAPLWGSHIYACPYCHGWEVRDRRWGVLLSGPEHLGHIVPFALMLLAWTPEVTVLTTAEVALPDESVDTLLRAGVRVAPAPVVRLTADRDTLASADLEDGTSVALDALFAHPPQRQVSLVEGLGLELDEHGFIRVEPQSQQTSRPGIYAAGDATTRMQSAILGAAAGSKAAAMLNVDLALDRDPEINGPIGTPGRGRATPPA